jgi:hypothetical protein
MSGPPVIGHTRIAVMCGFPAGGWSNAAATTGFRIIGNSEARVGTMNAATGSDNRCGASLAGRATVLRLAGFIGANAKLA